MTRKANTLPHWPRRMQLPVAAAYLGVSGSKLDRGWREGEYPAPRKDGKNCLWLKDELDDYIDRWAGSRSGKLEPWLRRMQLPVAAAYLGVSGSKLDRGWREGEYPAPRKDGKNCLWLKDELDDYIDRWAGSRSGKLEPWG